MDAIASQITSRTIVYSTVYSGADQRKPQSSASLAFVRGIHRWPVNSPHKWPVTRKMFPFDDVIMTIYSWYTTWVTDIASPDRSTVWAFQMLRMRPPSQQQRACLCRHSLTHNLPRMYRSHPWRKNCFILHRVRDIYIGLFPNDLLINKWWVFVKAFQILTWWAPAWLEIMKRVRTPFLYIIRHVSNT